MTDTLDQTSMLSWDIMPKKHIITIAGRLGSGKSTTSKGVAEQLGYRHFSSGDFFRSIAKEQGNDVLSANLQAENEAGIPRIDYLVDQRLREIGEQDDELVIDSRTAWHWIPSSFKVYLTLDVTIAAERIIKNSDPERLAAEHVPNDPAIYAKQLEERLASESRRYLKLYDIDPSDLANYDLVVDTGKRSPEEVIDLVAREYEAWRAAN